MALTDNTRFHLRIGRTHFKIHRNWKITVGRNHYWDSNPPKTKLQLYSPPKNRWLSADYLDIYLNLIIIFILVTQLIFGE